jgi:pimeloyl-ACP methyl ester carboxylesterase
LALIATYAALSVYKAVDYTTTPRQPRFETTPADLGLPYEEVAFPSAGSDDVTLRAWWLPNAAIGRVVILAHGRYESRASHLDVAKGLWEHGYSVLAFDLRGHGGSTREPCSYGVRERWDVIGAVRFVEQRGSRPQSFGVLGWSLGAASALLAMAETDDIAALVSDSAYADAEPLLARNALRPGLRIALRLVRDVNLDDVEPERAIAHIGARHVLIIHGAADGAVPVAHAERLRQAGGQSVVDTWIVPNAGHIQASRTDPAEYMRRVTSFFDTKLT